MDIKIIEVKKNGRTLCKINGRKYNLPNGLLKVLQNDSIPIEPPVIKPTLTILEIELLENLIRDNRDEGTYYGNKKHYYKRMETIEQKLNKMREAL